MAKKLLITEKPSVAMEFAKALKITTQRRNNYIEGGEWLITWCVGHLVTMSYPEKYDEKMKFWRLDTLPFIPKEFKYEVIANTQNQFNTVKTLIQREDVDTIYVSTDSGREGEYIYRLVDQMVGVKDKIKKRVWIDSQTEEEIIRGINEAKDLTEYDSLSDAAYLRAKEDYLIGINFSRLLSLIYAKRLANKLNKDRVVISVGRVMTCVLGMIVEREREIRNFVKTKYYRVIGSFGTEKSNFNAEWKVTEKSRMYNSPKLYNDNGFKKESDANEFIASFYDVPPGTLEIGTKMHQEGQTEELKMSKGVPDGTKMHQFRVSPVVQEVKKSKIKENAPLLYNLAELQNECAKRYKLKPDETLDVIQNLYEKKLVTYPRTDARVLSKAVAKEISKNLNGIYKKFDNEEIKGYINKMITEKYSTDLTKTKYVDDSKITDHYAIIPTGQGYENYSPLPDLHKNIYIMIVKRFLAVFYPPAEYNKISVVISIENEEFSASNKVLVKPGYLEIAKGLADKTNNINDITNNANNNNENNSNNNEENLNSKDKEEDNSNLEILKTLKKGQTIDVQGFSLKESETSPPTRYNAGSIILAMENAGKLIEDEALREQIKGAGIGTSATRGGIIEKLERINYIDINKKTTVITPSEFGEAVYDVVYNSMKDMLNPKLTASWEKGLDMVAKKEINSDEFMVKLEKYIRGNVDKFIYHN